MAEDGHAVLAVQSLVEQFEKELHFGGGMLALDAVQLQQVDVVAGLPQAEQRFQDFHPALVETFLFDHVRNALF